MSIQQYSRFRAILRLALSGFLLLLLCAGTAAEAAPKRPAARRRRTTPVVWKTRPPQLISLTTIDPAYRAAEVRLAQFIRALYAGRRAKAAELLSSKVPRAERQALIEKRWLREDPTRRKDFTQVLFMPDIQIRIREFYRDTVECYVLPRKAAPKKSRKRNPRLVAGYLRVKMRRERGKWWVEMRPGKV